MADQPTPRTERLTVAQRDFCGIENQPTPPQRYFRWKGVLDRVAAALLLIPGLPMIAMLVVVIRLASKGPGIYRQQRVGAGGRIYTMYKLRSMRCDAEAKTGPVWSAVGTDSRVTPLGYWLRKLHLDELPQLFNVIKGEMSLIGPRPERPEFVLVLSESVPRYCDRLRVPPGITGLAQINLPPDTDLLSVRRKLVLDLEYIESATLMLDLRVFLCTLLRIVGIRGDLAMRLMSLNRAVRVEGGSEQFAADATILATPEAVALAEGPEELEEQPTIFRLAAAASRQTATSSDVVGATARG